MSDFHETFKEDVLVNIFTSVEVFFDIYSQRKDMAELLGHRRDRLNAACWLGHHFIVMVIISSKLKY